MIMTEILKKAKKTPKPFITGTFLLLVLQPDTIFTCLTASKMCVGVCKSACQYQILTENCKQSSYNCDCQILQHCAWGHIDIKADYSIFLGR